SINLLRLAVPVVSGIVEIIDPQVIGAQRHRPGFLKRIQGKPPTRLADHREFFTRFPKGSLRNISGSGLWRSQTVGGCSQPRKRSTNKSSAFHLNPPSHGYSSSLQPAYDKIPENDTALGSLLRAISAWTRNSAWRSPAVATIRFQFWWAVMARLRAK